MVLSINQFFLKFRVCGLSAEQIDNAPVDPTYETTGWIILRDVKIYASMTKHFNNGFLQ